ncbi:VWD domain-containing protein [Nannocystis sp. SCPEA4]|uniref:VWD domain-containing protein n=1 Tax=Nannocystis sp. SCPEA4 TaxID=2996787 RepID=UPI00227228FF|nr:VWD domain-containing protein [Nannocystis sp. SCPEA4]MCY1059450.1 VWD domain-containing protein [Nannocystis sp. SCPEA4]
MRTRRLIFTSLSLAGLYGCGAGEPSASLDAVAPRNVPGLWDPPLESCLTGTTLTLSHTDGTVDIANGSVNDGLAQFARPGDLVQLDFSVTPGCLADHGSRLTLASYTTEGITKDSMVPVQPPQAYDVHTARFNTKGGTLAVQLPDCFFRVELAFGEPLATLTSPHGDDEGEKRRIAATQGGHASCDDVPQFAIKEFDTVEEGWGEAPLVTHFGWQFDVGKSVPDLTCELDFEGDGTVDHVWSPCPDTTSGLKTAALPVHVFDALGEHRPELVVSDGTRRLWASTTVLANHLDFKSDVRFPEKSANFIGAKLTPAQAPTLSELVLHYSAMKGIPSVAVGDVVVGEDAGGYMLRVVKRFQSGSIVTIYGHPVGLDETIAGGYFGVRDLQVSTENAHCAAGNCIGTLTPVAAPPGGASVATKSLALDAPTNQKFGGEETKYGIKLTVPLSGKPGEAGASEAELFAGIVVKKFAISGLLEGPLRVDVDVAPTIEVAVAVMLVFEDELELGDWIIGALPTPVPVTLHLMPELKFSSSFKFTGKFTAAAPFQLTHDENGWQHRFAPQISGDADMLETGPGFEYAMESKFTLVDKLGFALGFLYGPHVAPTAGLGIKATLNPGDCKFCMAVFGELGGEFGWEAPWGLGDILEPVTIGLVEHEFKKRCETILDGCDDPPPDPPGGGTWGDVHVVSHDGLLFDFQAGGEFVLVRSTVAGDAFEVQARQEPLGPNRSLSYNTAVATIVDGHRVGFYTDMDAQLYVDGAAKTLAEGQSLAVGAGVVTRAGNLYTLDYPGDDVLRVRVLGDHVDLDMALGVARAGKVEGVLGDANGDTANDIGLGGGVFLPQPVGFEALYRGDDSFTAAWRVALGATLFDYADPAGWESYRAPKYTEMPVSTPAPNPEHIGEAIEACGDCPEALLDSCMLDVAFTGDPAYAAACATVAATPTEVMYPADDYVVVAPRYGAPIDCTDERVVFRGPGLADADQWPAGKDLKVWVFGGFNDESSWFGIEGFSTGTPPPGGGSNWGDKFTCEPLGDGDWGECTLRLDPDGSPCNGIAFPLFRTIVEEVADEPALHDVAYFTRPPAP